MHQAGAAAHARAGISLASPTPRGIEMPISCQDRVTAAYLASQERREVESAIRHLQKTAVGTGVRALAYLNARLITGGERYRQDAGDDKTASIIQQLIVEPGRE